MAVTALIKYTQATVGTAGVAYLGTVAAGVVTVNNGSNTNVASWRITLLDVPPGSALALGVLASASTNTPSATFTPDVPGSYRVMLDLFDAAGFVGATDRDVRCFGIRNARGFIHPPYQKLPDPLPLQGSGLPGQKPDEQNYGGQGRGWAGDRTDGQIEEFFLRYDDLPVKAIVSTPFTAAATNEEPLYFFNVTGAGVFNLPPSARVGQRVRVVASSTVTLLTVAPPGGHTIEGLSSVLLFGRGSGTFVYRGSSTWVVIGAKYDKYERTIVAASEDTDQTGFVSIGSTVITPADFPNTTSVVWQAIIETTLGADEAEIRLYNVTTNAVVGSSTLSSPSLTPALVSATVSLAAGTNIYEAQLRLQTTGSPNRATCKQAQLIINWMQP